VVSLGPDASLVGKLLDDRYEMLEVIGDGGVGVVYRARMLNLERMVAVKVLHQALVEDAGFVGRFRREAVAMSRLYHPHCVAVVDSGVYDSRPYLVLEFLPGKNIRKLLEHGPFDPPRAVHIALQLLETLEYFHGHHVIHRDLKSENVMLVESSGTADFVKVLDFGMAKILTGPGADSQLSKMGMVPGTPSAMAPEQIHQLPPDPRIDIYATGILLYEMIVGRRPFVGPDMASVIKMQISTPPQPPREILGEQALSAELEQIIVKALEKDRIDRFATAAEMAAALRLTPEGRVTTAPPLAETPQPTASRRARRWVLPVLVAGIVLGAVAAIQLRPERPQARPAARAVVSTAELPPVVAPEPAPAPAPVPVPEAETWRTHRDLALSYLSRDQRDEAVREITAALRDDATQAGADGALARAAVETLTADRVELVVGAFRANPALVEALVEVTSTGKSAELRHAAYDGLGSLDQRASADPIAMRILDVEQAPKCSTMRAAWKELRTSKDPRVPAFKAALLARGRKDAHVRCLQRMLRR